MYLNLALERRWREAGTHHLVENESELERCRAEYVAQSGRATTLFYLSQASCRAFYRGGRLVAFYAVKSGRAATLRYAEWLPAHERWRLDRLQEDDCGELTCLLIRPGATSVQVYYQAMKDLRATGAITALAGSTIMKVVRMYSAVFPVPLYLGPSSFGPTCWIGAGPIDRIVSRMLAQVPGHLARKWFRSVQKWR
jgi:hypothetical protein